MGVTEIKSLQEFKNIINGDKPVVIDFGAVWCGPCRFIEPVFERMSQESRGVAFYRIDIDRAPDISQEVGIRSIPTFMTFKNGEKIESMTSTDQAGLQEMINKVSNA